MAEPLRDIEKSERLLRLVLDTLPVGVVVLNAAGDVVVANAVSSRIWAGMIHPGKETLLAKVREVLEPPAN